jgi:hypothetical protein
MKCTKCQTSVKKDRDGVGWCRACLRCAVCDDPLGGQHHLGDVLCDTCRVLRHIVRLRGAPAVVHHCTLLYNAPVPSHHADGVGIPYARERSASSGSHASTPPGGYMHAYAPHPRVGYAEHSPPVARVAARPDSSGMPPELAAIVASYAAQAPTASTAPTAPKPPGYRAFHDESRS